MIAPNALLFPQTHLNPGALARSLICFREIILYRLPVGYPDGPVEAHLARAEEKGWIRSLEADFFEDKNELKGLLRDFHRWGEQIRDFKDLTALRSQMMEEQDSERSSRLISRIRGGRPEKSEPDPRREAQIILHIAQEVDRSQDEVNRMLSLTRDREGDLGNLMGVEASEFGFESAGIGPTIPTGGESGSNMPLRLKSWGVLYESLGPLDVPLFTVGAEGVAELDLMLARGRSRSRDIPAGSMEALRPFFDLSFSCPRIGPDQQLPFDEIEVNRIRSEEWFEWLAYIASKSWDNGELAGLDQTARDMEATAKVPPDKEENGEVCRVTGFLAPGENIQETIMNALLGRVERNAETWCGPLFVVW